METSDNSAVSCLIWRACDRMGALQVRHVAELMRPLPIEPLADAPPFVRGLSIIRGRPTPVVDAGLLLSAQRGNPTRFVIVNVDEQRSAALAVDDVLGIRALTSAMLADLPPLLRAADGAPVDHIAALDGRLLVVLQSAHLIPSSVWAAIEEHDR